MISNRIFNNVQMVIAGTGSELGENGIRILSGIFYSDFQFKHLEPVWHREKLGNDGPAYTCWAAKKRITS